MIQIPKTALARLYAGEPTIKILPHKDTLKPPYPCGSSQPIHRQPDTPGDDIGEAKCRAHITRVTEIRLLELTDTDAQAAGLEDLDDLMADWVQRRGLWNEQARAWVLHLAYDPAAPVRLLEQQAGTLVGNGKPPRDDRASIADRGYTASRHGALRGELEAVDDEALETFRLRAVDGDKHIQQRRERDLDQVPLAQRLDMAIRTAQLKGIDIRDDLRSIEQRIRSAERRTHQRAA